MKRVEPSEVWMDASKGILALPAVGGGYIMFVDAAGTTLSTGAGLFKTTTTLDRTSGLDVQLVQAKVDILEAKQREGKK